MGAIYKAFGLLFVLPLEVIILLILSVEGGKYLDQRYPVGTKWQNILLLFSFLVVVRTFYKLLKMMIDDVNSKK